MNAFNTKSQAAKADTLRALHHAASALVLPNAWDVTSAKVVEQAGFPAIATTSAGIANALGYPDGEKISRDEMLDWVRRIALAVPLPVTADMEAGYADSAEKVYETIDVLVDAGGVGLNLEDTVDHAEHLLDLQLQLEKIKAVVEAGRKRGVRVVLNARTDAYWLKSAKPQRRLQETVKRAVAYREAGADCIFVPGLNDIGDIRRLLQESPGPLNVLAVPGAPSIKELESAGVRRVSIGSGGHRAALGMMRKVAEELRQHGTYSLLAETAIPYDEVNALLKKSA